MIKKKPKFLRIGYTQYSKLGLRRKNKQVYRKAKGGENKIRLKMKGHLTNVNIGYRSERKTRDLIKGLVPVRINSVEDLKKLKSGETGLVVKLGQKKKIAICEYASKNNIRLANINTKKFFLKIEEDKRLKKEEKENRNKKKKDRDKKAKENEKKKETEEKKTEEKEKGEKLEDHIKNTETENKENMEDKK